jgi:hypothetical protein
MLARARKEAAAAITSADRFRWLVIVATLEGLESPK